ncbi:MAG: hypothetical protein A3G76_15250 [Acidobacteria bacterium RIFCSPLOWO2_12_FULL_65_11]|nr:MAG: hypothetical protein A3H95_11045 [Acidobacteria bacterium RIFCSPLOWO2_02_FULL_64_15]OFW29019.1 MAG: hypothetical protein A3G76_15250 [Acidobacteria bacterium RIFCSPLOWO2_12_FULL_65_11]
MFSPLPATAQLPDSPKELYAATCAKCHADDGTGRLPTPTVKNLPRDFTNCALATAEPDADWELVTARGGPVAGLSSEMPAFGDAFSAEQISGLVRYARGFCKEPGWPLGNLNLPRALFTEKAYPENEFLIIPVVSHTAGEPASLRFRAVYERRLGRRAHAEIGLPIASTSQTGSRSTGVGDVAVAVKYVLHTNNVSRILTAGTEVVFPTGSESRGLGSGTTVFEPYLAAAALVGEAIVQSQFKMEFPAREPWADREVLYNIYVGHSLSPAPSTWTLALELNGVEKQLALTPQFRKPLTRTGALAIGAGVRVPIVNRSSQSTQVAGYLLWEYLDPVRSRP